MILPEEYLNNIKNLLKNDYEDYLKSLKSPRVYGLRANTLKIEPLNLKTLLNEELEIIDWCDSGFYYNGNFRPAKSPFYHAGLYYIQEPSAMSVASIIPIEEGDRVLDLCAAPGGKTTQIAAKLNGSGVIVSNDISATRCKALLKNIELAGITNALVTSEAPDNLAKKFEGFFDKIIIDAPCSGEGMFRKDENAVKAWSTCEVLKYTTIQKEILKSASKMLKNSGIIAYSTCTFNQNENEFMIKDFLNENDYSLIAIDYKKYGISKGIGLEKAARLWPHRQKGEGHFIALLKKNGFSEKINYEPPKPKKIDGIEYFEKFWQENLNIPIPKNIISHEKSLMAVSSELPSLKGLRIVRSGFYLGDIKTKRFEPSQALAMSLKKDNFKNIINFSIGDEKLNRYLKGESFEIDAKNGWGLVCVEGYPLGFCKVLNGRLKNKYSKSWLIS